MPDRPSFSVAEVGEPTQNGFAGRLMRTINPGTGVNGEEVDLSDYHDYYDAYQHIGRSIEDV